MKRCISCNAAMPSDPKGLAVELASLTPVRPLECADCRGAPAGAKAAEAKALEAQIEATVRGSLDNDVTRARVLGLASDEEAEKRAQARAQAKPDKAVERAVDKQVDAVMKAEEKHAAAHQK